MEKEVKEAQAQATAGKVTEATVPAPTGKGTFKDVVTVKGTSKNKIYPQKEFEVHAAHVPYLTSKGLIENAA
jgi:hypothetical protein